MLYFFFSESNGEDYHPAEELFALDFDNLLRNKNYKIKLDKAFSVYFDQIYVIFIKTAFSLINHSIIY